MSSPEDNIARPSSPSILSTLPRKRKVYQEEIHAKNPKNATKETQVSPEDIMTAVTYRRSVWDANQLQYNVSQLPPIKDQPEPSDPRNAAFARLVAFELDRVPEEKRSVTYTNIINLIRKVRQQKDLDDISLPSYEESD